MGEEGSLRSRRALYPLWLRLTNKWHHIEDKNVTPHVDIPSFFLASAVFQYSEALLGAKRTCWQTSSGPSGPLNPPTRSQGWGPGPLLCFLPRAETGGGGHKGGLPGPPVCLRRQPQPGENMSPKGDMRRNALRPELIRRARERSRESYRSKPTVSFSLGHKEAKNLVVEHNFNLDASVASLLQHDVIRKKLMQRCTKQVG